MSERAKGSTSVSLLFRLVDATTGKALADIDVTTLKLQFERPGAAPGAATSLTLLAALTTAWTSYGAREVDGTNSIGVYRIDCPDLAFATGADEVALSVSGASIETCTRLIDLTSFDSRDGVRGGLTALPNASAAASGGLVINGSNSGTLTLAALTVSGATTLTGNVALAAGLTITQSTSNGDGVSVTGNGTGSGVHFVGGATGHGVLASSGATSGDGIRATGNTLGHGVNLIGAGTSKHGLLATGGATTGFGASFVGGSTSGSGASFTSTAGHGATFSGTGGNHGINATVGGSTGNGINAQGGGTSGDGIKSTGGATGHGIDAIGGATTGDGIRANGNVAGHGLNLIGVGTSKHGLLSTGGAAGTSDGASLVAGTGGVDLRANITGNLTGTLSGAVSLADGAITEAKITLPTEATGTPTGFLQLMMWVAGMFGWRKVIKDDTTIVQKMADGTTTKTTSTYTSVAGTDTINKAT